MKFCIAAGILFSAATAALADNTYDMNIASQGVSQPQMHQNSQGDVILTLNTTLTPQVTDPAHPYHEMSGSCSGHLIIKGGSADGAGLCAYSNAAGDTKFVRYSISGMTSEGGFHGDWVSLGGTGKLAGATGGGTWTNSAVAGDGTFSQQIFGALSLP